jgi:GNAT superfamily N-acetyltransferase
MAGITIRRVPRRNVSNTNSDDFMAMAKLHKQLFSADYSPAWASTGWWVAEEDGKVVGFVGIEGDFPMPGNAHLARVGVKPGHQGRGIAKRLIRAAIRTCRREGYKRIVSYTRQNPPSSNALIGCGFRIYGPVEPWATKDALYLFLDL